MFSLTALEGAATGVDSEIGVHDIFFYISELGLTAKFLPPWVNIAE